MTMESEKIVAAEMAADHLIYHLAMLAGVHEEDTVVDLEEVYLENFTEDGTFAMETWTRFRAEGLDGHNYFAHIPGRLDELIARTVRDHSFLLGDE